MGRGATRQCRMSDTIQGAITMEAKSAKGSLRGGIDLGGTKIEAIVADSEHNVDVLRAALGGRGAARLADDVVL